MPRGLRSTTQSESVLNNESEGLTNGGAYIHLGLAHFLVITENQRYLSKDEVGFLAELEKDVDHHLEAILVEESGTFGCHSSLQRAKVVGPETTCVIAHALDWKERDHQHRGTPAQDSSENGNPPDPAAGAIAGGDHHMMTFANHPHHPGNETWRVGVVGVEGDQDVPVSSLLTDRQHPIANSCPESLIDEVTLDDDRPALASSLRDVVSPIGRTVVDNHHLIGQSLLGERLIDTIEELAKRILLVVGGQHHPHRAAIHLQIIRGRRLCRPAHRWH